MAKSKKRSKKKSQHAQAYGARSLTEIRKELWKEPRELDSVPAPLFPMVGALPAIDYPYVETSPTATFVRAMASTITIHNVPLKVVLRIRFLDGTDRYAAVKLPQEFLAAIVGACK